MFMLMACPSSLWDPLGVTFAFANMVLHLCSVIVGLQYSVTSEFTIHGASYGYYFFFVTLKVIFVPIWHVFH